jgi:hypothetical protein
LALDSYHLLDVYPDKTFRGERPFTRYELADALGRTLRYVEKRYQVKMDLDPRLEVFYQGYLKPSGDIPEYHWAAASLKPVLSYGLMSGTPDMRFHGQQKVSRYMLALTLVRMLDWLQIEPVALKTQTLRDLPADHWAAGAVQKLINAQVFEATDRFKGEETVTRYELAETLVKLLQQIDLAAQKGPLRVKETEIHLPPQETTIHFRFDGRKAPAYHSAN